MYIVTCTHGIVISLTVLTCGFSLFIVAILKIYSVTFPFSIGETVQRNNSLVNGGGDIS